MIPIATGLDILKYIPQRSPMVMIDTLFHANEKETKTGLTIKDDNIFVKNGQLSESGLVESIAQSAAASAGYFFISNSEEVKTGFIGSIKNLEILNKPNVGDNITTFIHHLQEVMNIKVVTGEIYVGETLLASCELKIFIVDEPMSAS